MEQEQGYQTVILGEPNVLYPTAWYYPSAADDPVPSRYEGWVDWYGYLVVTVVSMD